MCRLLVDSAQAKACQLARDENGILSPLHAIGMVGCPSSARILEKTLESSVGLSNRACCNILALAAHPTFSLNGAGL